MAKFCVILLICISLWIYANSAHVQLGEACDSDGRVESPDSKDNRSETAIVTSCDPAFPLACINGRCNCKRGYTVSRNGTKCLEIARNGLESLCEESIQCWKSLLGRLSECSAETGKCRCYESESLPIVLHQGRCYYGENLGDYCQIEGLCSATTPNAMCRAKDPNTVATCQCSDGYVPSWDKSRCLPIAISGLNSSCEENIQCEKSPLGTLSECNQDRMQCECYRIPVVPTVFHSGRCYFGAALGDVCQVTAQCQASTENSICGADGKCRCEKNGEAEFVENSNQTLCLPVHSSDGSVSECLEDIQCTRALGHFSRCNADQRKCECFSPDGFSKQSIGQNFTNSDSLESGSSLMVIVGAQCYSTKQLGQTCKFNQQCSALTPFSVCHDEVCQCEGRTRIASQDARRCLEIGQDGLGSPCEENQQCTLSILGPLSQCDPDTRTCSCSKLLPVVFYNKKCYFHRQLGASCASHEECQAGRNVHAECQNGRCQCENGTRPLTDQSCLPIVYEISGDVTLFPSLWSIMLLITLACIINSI